MTAAEKREKARLLLRRATSVDMARNKNESIAELVDILIPDDDEPAAPADWQTKAVALGTGWEKGERDGPHVARAGFQARWVIFQDGTVWYAGVRTAPPNADPLARCIAIDDFLKKLGVGA